MREPTSSLATVQQPRPIPGRALFEVGGRETAGPWLLCRVAVGYAAVIARETHGGGSVGWPWGMQVFQSGGSGSCRSAVKVDGRRQARPVRTVC